MFFGPNKAVIDSRSDIIKHKLLKAQFNIIKFTYDGIKNDLTPFWETIFSPSLFGNKKLIQLDLEAQTIKPNFIELLSKIPSDNVIIIKAGDLSPSHALRKYFEARENVVSIGCYEVDEIELRKLAHTLLEEKKIKTTPDIIRVLATRYDNSLLLKNDIELLDLWLGETRELSILDLDRIFIGLEEFEFIDLAYKVTMNDKKQTIKIYRDLIFKGVQLVSILRALLNFYHRVYSYLVLQENVGTEIALTKIYPPVYFKEKSDFLKICSLTSKSNILSIIEAINNIEQIVKKGDGPAKLCFENFLLHLNETNYIYKHIRYCMLAFND